VQSFLFNKKHRREYVVYGLCAGLPYVFTVWHFLDAADQPSVVLIIGSVFFMIAIIIYAIKLTRRKPEMYSTWEMLMVGQLAVAAGIIVTLFGSSLPWYVYIFSEGNAGDKFDDALLLIFATAVIENYIAGAFISAIVAYAGKRDQTGDETPDMFEEQAEHD
jgi:hypothetical protein